MSPGINADITFAEWKKWPAGTIGPRDCPFKNHVFWTPSVDGKWIVHDLMIRQYTHLYYHGVIPFLGFNMYRHYWDEEFLKR
jgi:hypothetical protein